MDHCWNDFMRDSVLIFPRLKTLILNDNQLTQILQDTGMHSRKFHRICCWESTSVTLGCIFVLSLTCTLGSQSSASSFPALESLSLNRNHIADVSGCFLLSCSLFAECIVPQLAIKSSLAVHKLAVLVHSDYSVVFTKKHSIFSSAAVRTPPPPPPPLS